MQNKTHCLVRDSEELKTMRLMKSLEGEDLWVSAKVISYLSFSFSYTSVKFPNILISSFIWKEPPELRWDWGSKLWMWAISPSRMVIVYSLRDYRVWWNPQGIAVAVFSEASGAWQSVRPAGVRLLNRLHFTGEHRVEIGFFHYLWDIFSILQAVT